jgi:hypothetical protein
MRKIQLRASVENIDDMIAFAEDLAAKTDPEKPIHVREEIQADLLQSGFGPGFFESLDLSSMFAIQVGYPFPDAGQPPPLPSDFEIAGVVPSHDARRLLDSMPDTYKPQPLGDGLWELIDGDFKLKLREKSTGIEFGREIADLDRAAKLPAEQGKGRRIRARMSNIPAEWLDIEQFFGPMSELRALVDVIRGVKSVEVEGEWGTDRDVVALAAAEAPFGELGLGPIGPPITRPSAIASMLPPTAALAIEMPWGDPKLIHGLIDRNVDPALVPAPFDAVVTDAIKASHTILDQLRDELMIVWYVDKKGQATLILAGAIKDEDATRGAVRTLLGSAHKAFSAHIALQGSEKDKKYTVAIKQDLKLSKLKTDRFTVTVPKFMHGDVKSMAMMLGKKNPRLEAYAVVEQGVAMLAIGAGAKKTVSDIARNMGRPRSKSLETSGGLALARTVDGGCQFCVAIDPVEGTRLYFVLKRDGGGNKRAASALKDLDKLRLEGQAAIAARVSDHRASLGLAFPRGLIGLALAR